MSNLYRLLGVTSQADDWQIKLAFRRLAKASHPDLNPGDPRAELRFREINSAYATLRDPFARAVYDLECESDRARARSRSRIMLSTMLACFVITVTSGLLVAAWMQVEARNRRPYDLPQASLALDKLPLSLGISD